MPNLALFDFDGTITKKETITEFFKFVFGLSFWKGIIVNANSVLGYLIGKVDNSSLKEALFVYFFNGKTYDEFKQWCSLFANERLPFLIRPDAIERIRWHQSRGDEVVIVSAGIREYIKIFAESMGINNVIAVDIESEGGILSGRLAGKNCYGEEKVRRIKEAIDLSSYDLIFAYGDTKGDREMLALAHKPYYRYFKG